MFIQNLFLFISYVLTILFLFYGLNQYYLLYMSNRYRSPKQPKKNLDQKPHVAIHLPTYNEKYVIGTLVSACWRMAKRYGLDKVRVVIIDDSDDETVQQIEKVVRIYLTKGLRIEVLHRADRTGFKAGALQAALAETDEEYIAIFDADFIPPANFLDRSVHFLVKNDKLGVVQSRWTHLNRNYNFLTKAIAIGIDVHFLIEQPARNAAKCFQNFNGSGGVLRKKAVLEAGGWQSDTLAEDLDISYRMQMAGYRIQYLKDLKSRGEIPPTVPSYKKQQARWACGSLRTARKILPSLLKRGDLGIKQKLEAFLHLTNYLVHPLILISFLIACLFTILHVDNFQLQKTAILFSSSDWLMAVFRNPSWLVSSLLIILSTLVAWISPMVALQRQHYSIIKNIPSLFTLFLLGSGLSLSNTIEAVKALFSNKTWSFRRTPKYNLKSDKVKWEEKSYQIPLGFDILSELIFACLGSLAIVLAITRTQWIILLFLIPITLAYAFVFIFSIIQSNPQKA
jgi:cellulose synthase/poly-beta-1,6-N-acetylglucosamine synthase-like glycosyltransferase